MQTMGQWVLREAGAHNLRLEEKAMPTPGAGEIVVRVAAVSLNYRDLWFIADEQTDTSATLPATPGSDMAGTVVATGAGVTRFSEGDDVLGTFWAGWVDGECPPDASVLGGSLPGVLAHYVVLHESWAVRAPRSLSAVEASTLPCAGLTAWFALVEKGAVHAGQTVVMQGTGGVALFGVQLARAHGAQVIATTSSAAKLQRVLELGATHGIDRNATPDWERVARELTGGRGVDHVFELAGGENLGASLRALRQGGRISLIGTLDGYSMSLPSIPSFLGRPTIQGIGVGHRRALDDLVRAVDALALKPVVDTVYAFDQLPAALAHLERGAFGKVVVKVGD
ncbi:NAD(P)-dependent alcohol dehydrogenase [Paraburkholderia sp. BCC1876]|uniref:zinc-dependent alcohol dehydrogenase family protein n=1 Tax=Paraburkholderia sp. BCC1876 TaxID=2676303 RepID=UPI0015904780|nr:NAD(P)-dependent alcohol dehydrogenase [Paraburkholderia sp. BCC1876]